MPQAEMVMVAVHLGDLIVALLRKGYDEEEGAEALGISAFGLVSMAELYMVPP